MNTKKILESLSCCKDVINIIYEYHCIEDHKQKFKKVLKNITCLNICSCDHYNIYKKINLDQNISRIQYVGLIKYFLYKCLLCDKFYLGYPRIFLNTTQNMYSGFRGFSYDYLKRMKTIKHINKEILLSQRNIKMVF